MIIKYVFTFVLFYCLSKHAFLLAEDHIDHPAGDHGEYGDHAAYGDHDHHAGVYEHHVNAFGDHHDDHIDHGQHHYAHHEPHGSDGYHGDDHHDDDYHGGESPMQKMIREKEEQRLKEKTDKTKLGDDKKDEKISASSNSKNDPIMKKFIKDQKLLKTVENIQESKRNIKRLNEQIKAAGVDLIPTDHLPPKDENYVLKEKSMNHKMCGLKKPLHEMPANYLVSQNNVNPNHVWEFGVNVMLQRFTVEFGYGDHCFHQPVLAKSIFDLFFQTFDREPILATIFDTDNHLLEKMYGSFGNATMFAEHDERLHVCFKNNRYTKRKVFMFMEVEPNAAMDEHSKVPEIVLSENRLSTHVRRIDAMLHYRVAQSTIANNFQEEYLRLMAQRSFCIVLGTMIVLALQVYFIHWIFDAPTSMSTIPYRMI